MKIVDVEGIILSEMNYRDSSKILRVLTEEYGLIGILSKGCRSLKSKLRASSRKLLYGTFHIYYKTQGLSTLISIDVIDSYNKIIMDLEKLVYASILLDLTEQVVKQTERSGLLPLLTTALNKIEQDFSPLVISNIIEIKYLDYLGVGLSVDGCTICGNTKNIVGISTEHGGFICSSCAKTNEHYFSIKAVQLLRMLYYVDISKISKIDVSSTVNEEIAEFIENYYEQYTGIYLKSRKTLKSIAKIVEK